jgi:hypothetical protein
MATQRVQDRQYIREFRVTSTTLEAQNGSQTNLSGCREVRLTPTGKRPGGYENTGIKHRDMGTCARINPLFARAVAAPSRKFFGRLDKQGAAYNVPLAASNAPWRISRFGLWAFVSLREVCRPRIGHGTGERTSSAIPAHPARNSSGRAQSRVVFVMESKRVQQTNVLAGRQRLRFDGARRSSDRGVHRVRSTSAKARQSGRTSRGLTAWDRQTSRMETCESEGR